MATPHGQSVFKAAMTEDSLDTPHWFAASGLQETASGCDEIFIRAGSASSGLKVRLTGFGFKRALGDINTKFLQE